MRILFLLLLLLPVLAFSQVGGSGVCHVSGNPNSVPAMETQDMVSGCLTAIDTLTGALYRYNPALSVGARWVAVDTDTNTNFANTDLTLTGNRAHALGGNTFRIRDAGDSYPDLFMNGTYGLFGSDANTYLDIGSVAGRARIVASTTAQLTSAGNTDVSATDTVTIVGQRIRLNAADTRIQQIPNDNALNRLVALDSLTGQLKYIDKSSISSGGSVTGSGTTGTIPVWSSSSALGDSPLTVSSGSVIAGGTGFFRFPNGTTAQRPGTPSAGMTRYNISTGQYEGYGASAWLQKSFPVGTTGQTLRSDGTNWVASSNLYHDGTGVGIGATSLGSARLVLKNSQEPARSTVVATQTFAADTTNWTKGTGWTFSGTTAVATAATGDLTYTPALTITSGNAYEVKYTISSYGAGTLSVKVGNATYTLPAYNITNNVVLLLPTSSTGGFRFSTSTFTGVLDNVTVVQVATPAPVLLAGQDDGATTAYNAVRMPNSSTWVSGGGGAYATGEYNFGTGLQSLFYNTTGSLNSALSYRDLYFNTTGSGNFALGGEALYYNTIGAGNTGLGYRALYSNVSGGNNFALSSQALYSNVTGSDNIASGFTAMYYNISGSYNLAQSREALYSNTTGSYNLAQGYRGLYRNTTGSYNLAQSYQALYSNTTGSYNLAQGYRAGYNTTAGDTLTGDGNILIGYQAANNIRFDADNNVVIGYDVDLPVPDGDNQLVLSNLIFGTGASGTGTTTAGKVGIRTNAPNRELEVAGEVRITDLTTDTPTRIVGADADGDLGAITVGSGLSLTSGTLSATGGAGTVTSVGITAPAAGITVSGSPVTSSGSMTLALADDLAAVEGLSANGIATRTASNTWAARTITGGSGIAITNGDGVSGNPTISRTYSLTQITISGGSTFFGTTPERPDNDTGGSVTVSTVGSDFGVSGSTLDYTGASGALLRVEGSVSFSVADDGDYYLSIFKEGTEIAATSTRVTCVAGNYYTIGLPATTTSGTTNDTFDVRIATVTGNSTTTMHRCGFIIERVY